MEIWTIVGSIASIIGVGGVVIALIQLSRTQKAAKAAEYSAKQTLERISGIVGVASIEQICSRSRQLLHVMGTGDLSGSATAALELRESLAKFARSKAALQIQEEGAWLDLLAEVGNLHDALYAAAEIKRIDSGNRDSLLRSLAKIHSELNALTGVATDKAGGI